MIRLPAFFPASFPAFSAALVLALACLYSAPANAAAEPKQYPFRIYALGIPIGKASIGLSRGAGTYHLTFDGKFGGLLALFSSAKGKMDINGTYDARKGASPTALATAVQWDKKLRNTVAQFSDGSVLQFEVTPPYTYEPEKRVPLDRADLHDVLDPLSSMLRPLPDGKLDCTPRLRIFDGRERYDLVFSPTGDPWTCHVQPLPMSGYDFRKKSPQHPSEPLDITYAPVEDGSLALPTRFVRDMLLGTVEVRRLERAAKPAAADDPPGRAPAGN